jgi:putative hydrolase of the HAD superfamily
MIEWGNIETVLLDMDGTLLDLNFDNHFWLEFVPQRFAEKNNLTVGQAKQQLLPQFKAIEGTLEWYCLDYWSDILELDIIALKTEISALISVLPHVIEFLDVVKQSPRKLILVTNAHRQGLELKMQKTCLQPFFDHIISSHDYGYPKEDQRFWLQLQTKQTFDITKTLLVDDSLAALNSAKQYGIKYLVSVSKPDSMQAVRVIEHYPAIEDFRALIDLL